MDASILDQILDKVSNLEGMTAYLTIFGVLFSCGMGIPIPEDVTIVTAGYLAYLENIDLGWAIVVCLLGVLSGDLVLFAMGHFFGRKILSAPGIRFIVTPERLTFAQTKLKKNQRKVVFTARFLAGLRAPVYLSAGMLGVRPRTFVLLDSAAAVISVPLLAGVGFYFGDELDIALGYIRRAERYILVALALVGIFVVARAIHRRADKDIGLED